MGGMGQRGMREMREAGARLMSSLSRSWVTRMEERGNHSMLLLQQRFPTCTKRGGAHDSSKEGGREG